MNEVRDGGDAPAEQQVALVSDTLYDSGTVDEGGPLQRPDMMMVYDSLRASLQERHRVHGVQMSTRKGRVLASSFGHEEQRMALAEKTAWLATTMDARSGSAALPADHAREELDGMHLFVVALDHLRLFAALFVSPPPEDEVVALVRRTLMEL